MVEPVAVHKMADRKVADHMRVARVQAANTLAGCKLAVNMTAGCKRAERRLVVRTEAACRRVAA